MAQKKKIQNLLTWCLSSVEGNDEVVLSWSFYGLAKDDDKVSPLFSKLFSEEKTSDVFRPVTTQPLAAASIASEQRRNSSVGRQK
ncbi:hypothetical protein Pyn_03095 [Prunus yedoensis var. nudiflora]|uniref:Uncharacterized protein n=1 Tax=Prunus yedoensis var. nudiflora TaxID=2094558 RepID=A0A314YR33_PRUYE|nr:hypothetical protein Pyn_03095 [Prunus yedoensis var. nudiflora]